MNEHLTNLKLAHPICVADGQCGTARVRGAAFSLKWSAFICCMGHLWLLLACLFKPTWVSAQEPVKIWEFSPYEVEVWYSFSANLHASQAAQQVWLAAVKADLQRTFQATWQVTMKPLPQELSGMVSREFNSFTLDSLRAGELVLVVTNQHSATKTLRTFEAAIETLTEIACTASIKQQLESSTANLQLTEETPQSKQLASLISKCVVDADGAASIEQKLKSATIAAALIPRWSLSQVAEVARPLTTSLPWQSDSLFRKLDKIFFLSISADGDETELHVRELDCPMQYLGPAMSDRSINWPYSARLATSTLSRAFAPVARVEDADSKTAVLRLRAGGLIVDKRNPALVTIGDVMQPIVRRDDRNGTPTLLEPLSWTFAAITASDGIKMEANVYTYSGGPGLQGRKNRRTQRMLLKVRPVTQQTDIELLVRDNGQPQSGCFVYRRDLLTDEFELLGRTDWRGRLTVPVPYDLGGFLPEAVRYQRQVAKREAEAQKLKEASETESDERAEIDQIDDKANGPNADSVADSVADVDVDFDAPSAKETHSSAAVGDSAVIPLHAPLTQIYIKNGDTVLAKLPMVPGLKDIETAQLPDDTRRLKAEAFIRGFQGEILDLIGLRNLLAARIQLHLKNGKAEQAKATLAELRQLKNYNEMSDQLVQIQRRMLDENAGPISMSSKNRIDRMFQTTRDMLQKYLQDNLLSDSEKAVSGL